MSLHRFHYATDICMDCGLSRMEFVEQHGPLICPHDDPLTHLKALQQLHAILLPILDAALSGRKPETRH